ncbi:MAG TPA: cbb3-type cytochrome c oxidase subunit 3 [Hyphomicrobiales bacterium]|nr:cbb3-type cytochrome c oxidase subunit 3 [Hyphomicrobiales bacterium]
MTYENLQSLSALVGLLLFMTLFAAVLAYVFWPGNRKSFEEASRIPFEQDEPVAGGKHGQ